VDADIFGALWLCAIYLNDAAAAALGLVWIGGRAVYFAGYSQAVEKRAPGFLIQSIACLLLFVGAAVGVARHWWGGQAGQRSRRKTSEAHRAVREGPKDSRPETYF
jgi:protein-S-isoprenylcysteine O-methyltransferase Ste14